MQNSLVVGAKPNSCQDDVLGDFVTVHPTSALGETFASATGRAGKRYRRNVRNYDGPWDCRCRGQLFAGWAVLGAGTAAVPALLGERTYRVSMEMPRVN